MVGPQVERHVLHFMSFVYDACLLHKPTLDLSPTRFGAAVFFVAMFMAGCKSCWPAVIPALTGLRVRDFSDDIREVYACLFERENVTDHRGQDLTAVLDRYHDKLEQANARHLMIDIAQGAPWEAVAKVIDTCMQEERRRCVSSRAATPTPTLRKFTGRPLATVTNIHRPHAA